jgi:hypothetical protein
VIGPGRLARLVAGDFAERSRTYAFLVTLILTVWATTMFVPPLDAGYTTVDIHGHRGTYGSAWIGAQLTLLVNAFLGLAGFYLVKSAIDRDRRSGVGQLLAATPLSRAGYTLSKTLSNLAVLASMVAVVVVCSAALQWARGEDARIDLVALALPHVLITLPFLTLVAAVAVLFEVLPVLRGGLGNVAWFFMWSLGGVAGAAGHRSDAPYNDPMGIGSILPGMVAATRAAFPAERITGQQVSIGFQIGGNQGHPLVPFAYGGIDWTPEVIGWRLLWLGAAVAVALAAALPFDRFANEGAGAASPVRGRAKRAGAPASEGDVAQSAASLAASRPFEFARLAGEIPKRRFDLPTLVRAEIVVALKGYPRIWYLVALGLSIAALAAPLGAVKTGVAPVLVIWPMLVWSALGARELRHGTSELFFSAPRPLSRQLPAAWLGGVAIGIVVSGAYALRLVLAGDAAGAITCLVGVTFAPALALACGVLTGNSRLFEALYLFLWYAAALNHVPELDFTGAMAAKTGFGVAAGYALATVALLAVAWTARRRQLTR